MTRSNELTGFHQERGQFLALVADLRHAVRMSAPLDELDVAASAAPNPEDPLAQREIAVLLQTSVPAVESGLHRGRTALRALNAAARAPATKQPASRSSSATRDCSTTETGKPFAWCSRRMSRPDRAHPSYVIDLAIANGEVVRIRDYRLSKYVGVDAEITIPEDDQ